MDGSEFEVFCAFGANWVHKKTKPKRKQCINSKLAKTKIVTQEWHKEKTTGPHSEREIKGAVLITMEVRVTVLKEYQ